MVLKKHNILEKSLQKADKLCIENKTWICQLDRTWQVKFEKRNKPSPWLSFRVIKVKSMCE